MLDTMRHIYLDAGNPLRERLKLDDEHKYCVIANRSHVPVMGQLLYTKTPHPLQHHVPTALPDCSTFRSGRGSLMQAGTIPCTLTVQFVVV